MTRYLWIAGASFETSLIYRSQVAAHLAGEAIGLLVRVSIWMTLLGSAQAAVGVTVADMVTYSVVAGTIMSIWTPNDAIYPIDRMLRSGDVAAVLVSPTSFPVRMFALEAGRLAYKLLFVSVPVAVAAALLFEVRLPATPMHAVLFVGSAMAGFGIILTVGVLAGIAAFWIMTAFSIDWLVRALLTLLSGTIIPFWFFAAELRPWLEYQPFAWIAYHPAAIYLGRVSIETAAGLLAIGLGWLTILVGVTTLLWRHISRGIVVNGG